MKMETHLTEEEKKLMSNLRSEGYKITPPPGPILKEKAFLDKLSSLGYIICIPAEKPPPAENFIMGSAPNSSGKKTTEHEYGDYHTNCSCFTCQDTRCDAENFP